MEDVKLGEPQVCPACKALNPAGLYLPFECLKCAKTLKEKTEPLAEAPCSDRAIKPCPFCGYKADREELIVEAVLDVSGKAMHPEQCCCPNCPAGIVGGIEVWNQRAL